MSSAESAGGGFSLATVVSTAHMQLTSPDFAAFCVTKMRDAKYAFLFNEQAPGRAEFVAAIEAGQEAAAPSPAAPPAVAPRSAASPSSSTHLPGGPSPTPRPTTTTTATTPDHRPVSAATAPDHRPVSAATASWIAHNTTSSASGHAPSVQRSESADVVEARRVIQATGGIVAPTTTVVIDQATEAAFLEWIRAQSTDGTSQAVAFVMTHTAKLEWAMKRLLRELVEMAERHDAAAAGAPLIRAHQDGGAAEALAGGAGGRAAAAVYAMSSIMFKAVETMRLPNPFAPVFDVVMPLAVSLAGRLQTSAEGSQYIGDLVRSWESLKVLSPQALHSSIAGATRRHPPPPPASSSSELTTGGVCVTVGANTPRPPPYASAANPTHQHQQHAAPTGYHQGHSQAATPPASSGWSGGYANAADRKRTRQ